MYESILLYSGLSAVPSWYVIYSLNRIRRHWKDGKEAKWSSCTFTLVLKLLIVVLIVVISAWKVFKVIGKQVEVQVFFALNCFAWLVSFSMLLFEFWFKLDAKWAGHRLFIMLGEAVWLVLVFTDLRGIEKGPLRSFRNGAGEFVLAGGLNLVLCGLTWCKPNEFKRSTHRYDKLLLKSTRSSYAKETSMFGKLQVKIRDYKIKEVNGRSVVIYNICVQFQDQVHYVKKVYNDFEVLAACVKLSFPRKDFPNISYPELPRNMQQGLSTDEKLAYLNDFLLKICQIDFCNSETLKFFNIQGQIHDVLLKEHVDMLDCFDAIVMAESDAGYIDLSAVNFEHSTMDASSIHSHCKYVEVSLKLTELESNKVEYLVVTHTLVSSQEASKTFKDFIGLHKQMKKYVNHKIMPKFPKKSYFHLVSKSDSKSAETRRKKLEDYLKHLLNDPVYHINELFEFIGFRGNYQDLWIPSQASYNLLSIEWETGVDEDEAIIFVLLLTKDPGKLEWQVKRQYKDFEWIHNFLQSRSGSEVLQNYYEHCEIHPEALPDLPKKLTSLTENVEILRESLETYMRSLLSCPYLLDSHAFVRFVNENS